MSMDIYDAFDLEVIEKLYSQVEQAIVCDWLGIKRFDKTSDIDIEKLADCHINDDDGVDGSQHGDGEQITSISLKCDPWGRLKTYWALRNAVARLALNGIQGRLPQWGGVDHEGNVLIGREMDKRVRRVVDTMPVHLFTIDWGGAPGYANPEAYYATYMPGFNIYVVTGSYDSTSGMGYSDHALGCFGGLSQIRDGSKEAILKYWQGIPGIDEPTCWESFYSSGLISEEEAMEWRDTVWDDCEG